MFPYTFKFDLSDLREAFYHAFKLNPSSERLAYKIFGKNFVCGFYFGDKNEVFILARLVLLPNLNFEKAETDQDGKKLTIKLNIGIEECHKVKLNFNELGLDLKNIQSEKNIKKICDFLRNKHIVDEFDFEDVDSIYEGIAEFCLEKSQTFNL